MKEFLLTTMLQICHRVILDSKEFNINIQPDAVMFILGTKDFSVMKGEHLSLSEEELVLCDYEIPGYSLVLKRWGMFDICLIKEIEFNGEAFISLVLAHQKKSLISSLVKDQSQKESGFDDVIKGKGKGLIFLLHGEPGTGKTLTAGTYMTNWYHKSCENILTTRRKHCRFHTATTLYYRL
jgi:hypothetical protein